MKAVACFLSMLSMSDSLFPVVSSVEMEASVLNADAVASLLAVVHVLSL